MDCPMCDSSMKKINNLEELPAYPYDWYKYKNYETVYKVFYCEYCKIIMSFGKFKVILYYIKNIIKEIRMMLLSTSGCESP